MSNDTPAGRIRLRRNSQMWHYDKTIKDTGRPFHFQFPGRGPFPESVRMHKMISKQLGKSGQKLERLADAEAKAGHDDTALDLYFDACRQYMEAQHAIFENTDEKRFLHESLLRCDEQVRRLAPYTIEHLDIPWGDTVVSGNLHLAPVEGPAPTVFLIPGCDMTKEMLPHPHFNQAAQRGMHLFSFDGPGQGENNLRGTKLTTTNYEEAASAALSHLLERPEIDDDKVTLLAMSFGSYWGVRFAATDHRLAAAAFPAASVCDKYYLMEEESPRYKQLFAYLTQSRSEDELDQFIAEMDLTPLVDKIECPTLLTAGEYDPRSPIEEVYEFYDAMQVPKELWVYEDQHHMPNLRGLGAANAGWMRDLFSTSFDWLRDRIEGRPVAYDGQVRYLEAGGGGPNDPSTRDRRTWFA